MTFFRDEQKGTTATLIINPPEAFIPEPIVLIPSRFPDVQNVSNPVSPPPNPNTVQYPAQPNINDLVPYIPPINASSLNPP